MTDEGLRAGTATPATTTPTTTTRKGRALAWISSVKFADEKGFMFAIVADGTGEELFVHRSAVPPALWDMLEVGDPVSCKVSDTPKGPRAFAVARVTDEAVIAEIKAKEEAYGNR